MCFVDIVSGVEAYTIQFSAERKGALKLKTERARGIQPLGGRKTELQAAMASLLDIDRPTVPHAAPPGIRILATAMPCLTTLHSPIDVSVIVSSRSGCH